MLGWVDIRTFGTNVYLIIGAVVVLAVLFLVILTIWTLLKIALWQGEIRRARQRAAKERLRDDGQPYPPVGRGLCDVCAKPAEKIYYLPSGQRMCDDCYRRIREDEG